MKYLVILNDPPYGTERSYNGLRLAGALAKVKGTSVYVFLMGDAAGCAVAGQTTPTGYYNIERMLKPLVAKGGKIGVCGSCMDARGITPDSLVQGAHRSSMDELAAWTEEADKVLVFQLWPSADWAGHGFWMLYRLASCQFGGCGVQQRFDGVLAGLGASLLVTSGRRSRRPRVRARQLK